ncbi:MAG: AbrB/MazE/SpoVT family DNA-binding domain-containing protein, partial [bacterium]
MTALKLTTIGTSTGLVIPKDLLARLNIAKGDTLYAVETADGGLHLTPYD